MRIGEATNQSELLNAAVTARDYRLMMRRPHEVQWWNNIAMVAGDHHARYDPNKALFEDRDPNWTLAMSEKKARLVVNHSLSVARTELSKLSKSRPIMDVIANSNEPQDIAATKVAKSALDYAEWKFKLQKMRRQAWWWMFVCGVGAIYCGWDYLNSDAGMYSFLIDPETSEPTFSPHRRAEIQGMVEDGTLDEMPEDRVPLGELEYAVFSPFQLLPDPAALDFQNLNDLITTEVVDIDVLKGWYGRRAALLKPEDTQLGTMERLMMDRIGVVNPVYSSRDSNACYLHTLWLTPDYYRGSKFLKNGVFFRWAQGKILDFSASFPFIDGRIPFVFYEHIPAATSIWPDCNMTQIRGLNLEIDKTTSQLIESKDFMSNPMWLLPSQCKVKGEIKNVAGGMVRYVHVPNVPPPQPIQGLTMPAQVESLLAGMREQILDVSGQSEVTRGNVPTGVRSGVAVAYLQEEDDTKLGPTIENAELATALLGSLTLCRFGQFYTENRIIRFYRRDGQFDAMAFKGADLKNNTDVICQAGSAMPKSKAARQQYTLELVSLGVLTDPKEIKEELDLGAGEPDNQDKAIAQADRENQKMLHGMQMGMFRLPNTDNPQEMQQLVATAVPVKAWMDHATHIQRHTSAMMDEEFDKLSSTHPGIPRLFDEHVALHQQFLAQQQQQQMQMQAAAKGAPAQVGGTPAGQQALPGNVNESRQMTPVPDVIGGGLTQLDARMVRQHAAVTPGGGR
jgi:hypothetical protein